jgi:PhnB protein
MPRSTNRPPRSQPARFTAKRSAVQAIETITVRAALPTGSAPPPDGYHSVNPYIVVDGVENLIVFLSGVFDGTERGVREVSSDGVIEHAEIRIGDSVVMLSEASPAYPARPSVHFVYVEDADAAFAKAIKAGASPIHAPTDQPWGDRVGGFHDPFGNRWWVARHQPLGSN